MSFIDGITLFSITAIWFLMIIQIILSIGGFIYYMKVNKTDGHLPLAEVPMVTIMVPAHNEGIVIVRTVEALLNFNYPKDKYEIIVINDNSSDNSAELLANVQEKNPDRLLTIINTDHITGGKGLTY